MKVEISRRRFLQGSVALSVAGGVALGTTDILASSTPKKQPTLVKKVPTVVKCVSINAQPLLRLKMEL